MVGGGGEGSRVGHDEVRTKNDEMGASDDARSRPFGAKIFKNGCMMMVVGFLPLRGHRLHCEDSHKHRSTLTLDRPALRGQNDDQRTACVHSFQDSISRSAMPIHSISKIHVIAVLPDVFHFHSLPLQLRFQVDFS